MLLRGGYDSDARTEDSLDDIDGNGDGDDDGDDGAGAYY